MGVLNINFGPGYKNNDNDVWSVRRQVLTTKELHNYSNILNDNNNFSLSSSTKISVPLRGTEISSPYTYENIKVLIFKGFNNSLIETNDTDRWFSSWSDTYGYGLLKFSDDSEFYFDKINIEKSDNPLGITPLAYFSGSNYTVTASGENFELEFTNPYFTEEGKKLSTWYVSSSQDDYPHNRIYVGVYLDKDYQEDSKDLNWYFPTFLKTAVLQLVYSNSTIKYKTENEWKDCEIFYYNNGTWQPCSVQYYLNNTWKNLGG